MSRSFASARTTRRSPRPSAMSPKSPSRRRTGAFRGRSRSRASARGTAKISSVFAHGDWNYRSAKLDIPLTVTVPPNALVASRSFVAVQSGESRSFSVRLRNRPPEGALGLWELTNDPEKVRDPAESVYLGNLDATVEPSRLAFDRDNWNEPQHVVVTGGAESVGAFAAVWAGREGDDLAFAESFLLRVEVSAARSIKISHWNGADRDGYLQIPEGGEAGYGVALGERPTGTVTVSGTSHVGASVHPSVLTFTPENWNRRQTVTLVAAEDIIMEDESHATEWGARGGGYDGVSRVVPFCVAANEDNDGDTCEFEFPADAKRPEAPGGGQLKPGGGPSLEPVVDPGRAPRSGAGDTAAPRLVAWKRHAPASQTTDADALTWRLTFTEPVTGVTASHFTVRVNGSSKHAATPRVRGSGTTWNVTVSGGGLADLNGTVALGFRTKRGITDRAGNAFTNTTPLSGAKETTYTLKNAAPARFSKGDAALSRLSRSIGLGAIGVVTGRAGASGGSSLTLAGRTIPLGGAGALAALETGTPGNMGTMGGGLLPGNSAGNVHLQDAGPGRNALTGAGQGTGNMTDLLRGLRFEFASADGATRVWGQGDAPLGGGLTNRFLGMERRFGGGLLAGAALSFSESAGNFGLDASEAMASRLSSAYQYLRFTPGQATEVWSLVGAGKGTAAFTDAQGAVTTELSMEMLAFGSRHAFREATVWGWVPAVSADGFMVRLSTPHTGGLRALGGQASRLRAGVTLARPSAGDGWSPQVGLGLRHEDDERGTVTRTEVRAGLGWVYQRLTVDGMAHLWPSAKREAANAATAGLAQAPESWGARLTARWAAPGNLGFTASLDALTGLVPDAPVWENETVATQASDLRFGLRAGYGLAVGGARWTPFGEARVADGAYTLRESLRYERGALRLDLHGEHQRRLALGTGHGIRFDLTVQF